LQGTIQEGTRSLHIIKRNLRKMATKAIMCMIQMPADAPEKDVKIVKTALGLSVLTVYGGWVLSIVTNVILSNRPNAEEMSSQTDQERQRAQLFALVWLVVSLGCSTGCFGCLWAGLKNKNQSLLRANACCMFFGAVMQLLFQMIISPKDRADLEDYCKKCEKGVNATCTFVQGRGPGIPLNTKDCGFYGNRDYVFQMVVHAIWILLQCVAGALALKLSESMTYFVTSKMDQFRAQQGGQVQVVGTAGAPMVVSQPTIVSSGQPTIVSSGQPTIVSSGQPTIVSSGQPTIVKTA